MSGLHLIHQYNQSERTARQHVRIATVIVLATIAAAAIGAAGGADSPAVQTPTISTLAVSTPAATVLPPHAIIANDLGIAAAAATDAAYGSTPLPSQDAPGVPAIEVAPGASGVTRAAVEAHVRGLLPLLRNDAGDEPVIASITHMTAAVAGEQLGSAILRPDDEWVWVVRLAGDFAVDDAPIPWSTPTVTRYATYIEVYSAASGNLLRITWDDERRPTAPP